MNSNALNSNASTSGETDKPSVSFSECESASEESDDELARAAADCDLSDDDVERARAIAAAARSITADDVCTVCGGRGHWSKSAGQTCLTALLGIKIPNEELQATKYPRGIKYPSMSRVGKYKKYDKPQDGKRVSERHRGKSPRRPIPRRPKSPQSMRRSKPSGSPHRKKWGYKSKHASANEVQASSDSDESEDDSDDDTESAKHVSSLAIDYGSIITPPPSPPESGKGDFPFSGP